MKGLRFADTQKSCFEAWKHSHMGCAALLCGRFDNAQEIDYLGCEKFKCGQSRHERTSIADPQESRFQSSKRSDMVLVNGPSADIQEFCFQAAKCQTWTLPNCKGVNLLIVRIGISMLRNVQIRAVPSCKGSIC